MISLGALIGTIAGAGFLIQDIKMALPQNLWVASAIRCCFRQRILGDLADFLVADCDGDFQ